MAILIVEDSPAIAQMLTAILKQGGFNDMLVVSSGEEVLDLFNEKKKGDERSNIELVLLDLVLPGMNGLDVCRALKKREDVGHVPVIVVTAKNDVETMQAAFEVGAWDFLVKPVKGFELIVRVKAALAKKREIEERLKKALLGQ